MLDYTQLSAYIIFLVLYQLLSKAIKVIWRLSIFIIYHDPRTGTEQTEKKPNLNRKNNDFYNGFRLFFAVLVSFSTFFIKKNFFFFIKKNFLLEKKLKFVQFFKTVNWNKNWKPELEPKFSKPVMIIRTITEIIETKNQKPEREPLFNGSLISGFDVKLRGGKMVILSILKIRALIGSYICKNYFPYGDLNTQPVDWKSESLALTITQKWK